MGEKLIKYYRWAEEQGGLAAKVQLAQQTKIPSVNAALAPDDLATIGKFREALRKVTSKEPPSF